MNRSNPIENAFKSPCSDYWPSGLCKSCYPDNPPRGIQVGNQIAYHPTHNQPSGHLHFGKIERIEEKQDEKKNNN